MKNTNQKLNKLSTKHGYKGQLEGRERAFGCHRTRRGQQGRGLQRTASWRQRRRSEERTPRARLSTSMQGLVATGGTSHVKQPARLILDSNVLVVPRAFLIV